MISERSCHLTRVGKTVGRISEVRMDDEFNVFMFGIAFALSVLVVIGGIFHAGYKYGQSHTIVVEEVPNEAD